LLLTALGGLLIAGLVTAIPVVGTGSGPLAGYINSDPVPSTGSKSDAAFSRATSGDCLMWPDVTPVTASIVKCADNHKFEVAESIDMRTFPGSEYGPNAAPPSPARIQQISQEQCEAAVRRYLGTKFDPNSKFSVSMLWSGDRAWRQSGERRMLCGLQMPGPNNEQAAFKGKVADVDQSKVWPTGTCLGIDSTTNQPVDVPVDCGAPHAMEVTGTVNLAEKFPAGLPAEPEQDGFIKDSCTKMTDAYLAPIKLRTTTLTLIYPTVSLPSWSAGSHEVACSIGATLGNGGWATLVNSAKGDLLINGQPPVPPPDIPEERLTLPSIPLQVPVQVPANQPSAPPDPMPPGNQHLPQQQPVVTPPRSPASQAPTTQAPQDGPPPPADGLAPPPANPAPLAPPANPAPEAPAPAPAEPAPGG
jgi:predicted heme/steroid binding protein